MRVEDRSAPDEKWMEGVVTATGANVTIDVRAIGGTGETFAAWDLINKTRLGVTICNTTNATSGYSQDITAPPLMRVAFGDYGLWTANEEVQCRWNEETSKDNSNIMALTGISANKKSPVKGDVGLNSSGTAGTGGGDFTVKVVVCDNASGLLGVERCLKYPDNANNYKPIGLLQVYGENDSLDFGLMTGSYEKNMSGGVLRKNVGSITDEINLDNGILFDGSHPNNIQLV